MKEKSTGAAIAAVLKWPAIGILIGGGALLVGRIAGPSVAEKLGRDAGAGFARGVARGTAAIAAARRSLDVSGWGTYR